MSTILRNCRVVGRGERLRDLLISGGLVRSMTDAGALSGAGETGAGETGAGENGAEQVDLDGRFVGSGLWDHHVHMDQWALTRRRVDVRHAESAAHAARVVGERLNQHPPAPGEVLVGFGFRDALWADEPIRETLDAVSGRHPVALVSGDIHAVWLNSAALRRFGLRVDGPGLLREQDAFVVNVAISDVAEPLLDAWVDEAAADAAARGVVGVVELEMADNLRSWTRRITRGTRSLRIRAGVYLDHLDHAIAAGLRTGAPIDGTDGLLSLGPFKIITDGSLNTRTALCHEPYARPGEGPGGREEEENCGLAGYGFDELVAHLRRASSNGIVPAVHAIGDRANQLALDAFEEVGCRGGIEHAQLVSLADFARFAELGITAGVQPEHAMDDRDVADRLWAGRTDRAFAFDSLLDAGAELRLGSDAPVSPLDPWVSMAAAVSRSRDGREPWHPEQRIVVSAAYAASVERPLLSAGDPADFAITEVDPLRATDAALRTMVVAGTILGGEWTHRAL